MPPIDDDEQVRALLADNRITAISIDTNIFHEKHLQLNSATLQALTSLKDRPFDFVLSGTVANEVLSHLKDAANKALASAEDAIQKALGAFETKDCTREQLLEQITRGQSAEYAATTRLNQYVEATGCELLNDAQLVSTATLFEAYFAGEPPFGHGKKKSEFPDALVDSL